MFCIKCGAQNPDDASFCHQCGKRLFKPETNLSDIPVAASAEPVAPAQSAPTTEPTREIARHSRRHKWVTAYGWLFVVAGLSLLVAGRITALTPAGSVNPLERAWAEHLEAQREAQRLGISPAELERRREEREEREEWMRWGLVCQGLLFGATGLAILWMSEVAVTLVWVTVVLSGLGVIFRGVMPLDLLLWLVSLGLAVWYTKKRKSAGIHGTFGML